MRCNRWMGKYFHQWIERKIVEKFGWEFWQQNRYCDFSMLQKFASNARFQCPDYEYQVLNDLRAHGLPVEHQVIYLNRYIADLALPKARVVLELDGPYHEHKLQKERDGVRKKLFMAFGFTYHAWPMPMNRDEYERKLGCFVKAYSKYLKPHSLRPIARPSHAERLFNDGTVQKQLPLKVNKARRK